MIQLNAQYRGIRKDTDVLSFPLMPAGFHQALGDIVISVPRALQQARAYNVPFHEELLRLLAHGLLHLIGYDHELNAYQRNKMLKKEKELLDAITKVA